MCQVCCHLNLSENIDVSGHVLGPGPVLLRTTTAGSVSPVIRVLQWTPGMWPSVHQLPGVPRHPRGGGGGHTPVSHDRVEHEDCQHSQVSPVQDRQCSAQDDLLPAEHDS